MDDYWGVSGKHKWLSKLEAQKKFRTPEGVWSMKLVDDYLKDLPRDHATDVMCNISDRAPMKFVSRLQKKYCDLTVPGYDLDISKPIPLHVRDRYNVKTRLHDGRVTLHDKEVAIEFTQRLHELLSKYTDITPKEYDFLVQKYFRTGLKLSTISRYKYK